MPVINWQRAMIHRDKVVQQTVHFNGSRSIFWLKIDCFCIFSSYSRAIVPPRAISNINALRAEIQTNESFELSFFIYQLHLKS